MSVSTDPALDAFALIAEGVTVMGGFGVAAISVVRGTDLVVEAVSGSEAAREHLLGTASPVADLLAEVAHADDWGRFRFLPQERLQPDHGDLGWVPDLAPLDLEDAWQPLDLLIAPLTDVDGTLLGTLALDLPADGRRPGPEQQPVLEVYAEQATRAVRTALRNRGLAEQVRLARTARSIVSAISTELTMEALLDACNEAVVEGFGAVGLWIQTFDAVDRPGSGRVWAPEGLDVDLTPELRAIAEAAAPDVWLRQQPDVVTVGESETSLPRPVRDVVDAFLTSLGVAALLFVPLGAGSECVGVLCLTRGEDDPTWSEAEIDTAMDIGRDIGRAVLNARTFERERELVAELRALDTYKEQLISTLAHELKNPLTVILAHLELLEESALPAAERSSLAAMDRGAERLRRITDDLMTLSKVGDPATPLIAAPVDLVKVVTDVADLQAVLAETGRVEVALDLPDEPVLVLGEAVELDRMVSNLLGNAIKYTRPGGRACVQVLRSEGQVRLVVTDTGIGISEDDQQRLFTEFFRSNNPLALEQPGTGLGLPIVSRIVARHRGRLEVSSELGVGSTFTVSLPGA